MILQAMIFGLKNKISQLKGFKSISITVYLCLRVLAIYLEEFYGGIIYLGSKKSAGYDFAGYDFPVLNPKSKKLLNYNLKSLMEIILLQIKTIYFS